MTSPIVDREELQVYLRLERVFIDRWTKAGAGGIPPMPHLVGLGRATKFHLPSVEAWLLKHFTEGGAS